MAQKFTAPDFSNAFEEARVWVEQMGQVQSPQDREVTRIISEQLKGLSGREITTLQLAQALLEGRNSVATAFPSISENDLDRYALTLLHPFFYIPPEHWIIDETRSYYSRLKRGDDILIEE